MVIQCSECQTRFKLADDKMKPGGIKVRCAKCKHVFQAVPPAAPAGTVQPPPAPAPEAEETSFAGLTTDQDSRDEFSFGASRPSAQTAVGAEDAAFSLGRGGEKPPWDDFDLAAPDAPPAATPTPSAAPEPEDFGFGDLAPTAAAADDQFRDFAVSTGPGRFERDLDFIPAAPEATADDDFDFGPAASAETADSHESASRPVKNAADDFGFGEQPTIGIDDLPQGDIAGHFAQPAAVGRDEDDFDFSTPSKPSSSKEMFDFGTDDDSLQFTDPDTAAPKTPAWGDLDADPFGDDFDLSADGKKTEEFDFAEMGFKAPPQVDQLGDDDFGSIALQNEPAPEPLKPAAASSPGPGAAVESGDRSARAAAPAPVVAPPRSPLKRLVLFVLGLLLTLLGAAGYFLWQAGGVNPLLTRLSGAPPAPVTQPQIRLTNLNGYFVTNKDAGQLFVIQGQAINEYPETRSALTVKGALYDKAGKLLVQQTVFCGNHLDDQALQDYSFAKISEAMNNQFGDTLSNLNVASGKAIPFTIVFRNFPPELAEFTVESVDSKPGSK